MCSHPHILDFKSSRIAPFMCCPSIHPSLLSWLCTWKAKGTTLQGQTPPWMEGGAVSERARTLRAGRRGKAVGKKKWIYICVLSKSAKAWNLKCKSVVILCLVQESTQVGSSSTDEKISFYKNKSEWWYKHVPWVVFYLGESEFGQDLAEWKNSQIREQQ